MGDEIQWLGTDLWDAIQEEMLCDVGMELGGRIPVSVRGDIDGSNGGGLIGGQEFEEYSSGAEIDGAEHVRDAGVRVE